MPPLQWISKAKNTNAHITCWFFSLQDFSFHVQHRAGTKHRNADGLSKHYGLWAEPGWRVDLELGEGLWWWLKGTPAKSVSHLTLPHQWCWKGACHFSTTVLEHKNSMATGQSQPSAYSLIGASLYPPRATREYKKAPPSPQVSYSPARQSGWSFSSCSSQVTTPTRRTTMKIFHSLQELSWPNSHAPANTCEALEIQPVHLLAHLFLCCDVS